MMIRASSCDYRSIYLPPFNDETPGQRRLRLQAQQWLRGYAAHIGATGPLVAVIVGALGEDLDLNEACTALERLSENTIHKSADS